MHDFNAVVCVPHVFPLAITLGFLLVYPLVTALQVLPVFDCPLVKVDTAFQQARRWVVYARPRAWHREWGVYRDRAGRKGEGRAELQSGVVYQLELCLLKQLWQSKSRCSLGRLEVLRDSSPSRRGLYILRCRQGNTRRFSTRAFG